LFSPLTPAAQVSPDGENMGRGRIPHPAPLLATAITPTPSRQDISGLALGCRINPAWLVPF